MIDPAKWGMCWMSGCTTRVDTGPDSLGLCRPCAEWLRDESQTMDDKPAKRMAWSDVLG